MFLPGLVVVVAASGRSVAVVFLAIGGELDFFDINLFLGLLSVIAGLASAGIQDLTVLLVAHRPEVELTAENHPEGVG